MAGCKEDGGRENWGEDGMERWKKRGCERVKEMMSVMRGSNGVSLDMKSEQLENVKDDISACLKNHGDW